MLVLALCSLIEKEVENLAAELQAVVEYMFPPDKYVALRQAVDEHHKLFQRLYPQPHKRWWGLCGGCCD